MPGAMTIYPIRRSTFCSSRRSEPSYSGRCRVVTETGVVPTGESVIPVNLCPGTIEFSDHIRGDVRFEGDLIEDFVLLRSD